MHRPLVLFALAVALSTPVLAQEVQVPLDESGRLMVIDVSTEGSEEVFPEYRGFREARLFQTAENEYVLEILYRPDDAVLRDRKPLTAEEVRAFRARVQEALGLVEPGSDALDQSGRARLLRQVAVTSFLFYGPALPVMLELDDEAATAVYLGTASAGFFVPYFLTRNAPVTHGAATLSRVGAAQGALHGLAIPSLLAGSDVSGRALFGWSAVGSAAEAYLGYKFGIVHATGRGEAEMIGSLGLFGAIAGLGMGGILSVAPDDDLIEPQPDRENEGEVRFYDDDDFIDKNVRIFSGATLVGSLAGMYAGYALAHTEPYTRGDSRVLTTLGILGVNAGILAIDLSNTNNGRVGSAMIVAGTVAGVAAGRLLTTERDFTAAQGAYVGLAAAAGGLAGLSAAAILDATATTAYVLGTTGAMAGFGLMYAAFSDNARAASASRDLGALDFEVNPLGVMAAVRGEGPAGTGV
ncbi:MAG TPA: hypothetical protein VF190_08520, partial [Rhodothermales bacterium]